MQDLISDKTWASINARVTALREGDQQIVRQLSQQIGVGISTYWKRRLEETDSTIESPLASDPPCKRGMVLDAGVVQGCRE